MFFFFQAEDGIRDADVTGVQTCALPIYPEARASRASVATRRFTLVWWGRGRLLWGRRVDRKGRKTAPQTRRRPAERTWRWQPWRGLLHRRRRPGLHGLRDRRRHEDARRRW